MKTFFILFLTLCSFPCAMAQNFSYEYQGPQTTAQYLDGRDVTVYNSVYTATIMANEQNSGVFHINHIVMDNAGQLQNLFKYKGVGSNMSLVPGHSIFLPDGSQLISGFCYPDFDAGLGKPFVMSIANNGTLNWAKNIDSPYADAPFIKVLSDGSVLCIFQYTTDNIGYFKAFCKIDANGNFSNFKKYSLEFDHPSKIIANSNGTFDLMTLKGNLMNIENDLSAINWVRKYYTEGGVIFNRAQNGDYLIASVQTVFGHGTFFRTDANGNVIWAKKVETFEGVANNPFQATHFDFIQEDSQGNIVAAVYQVNSGRTMHVVLDANGNFLSNFSTINSNNTSVYLGNDQLLLLGLNPFPGFDFQIEKRDLGVPMPCDITDVSHNILNGNAMELTPPSLSLTTIVDFATTDINIAISDETQTLNQVAFCNLGIAENNLASTGIEVYPNPTTGNLNIEAKGKIDQINLYDSMGRLIGKFDQASINIGKESAGYYFLEVVVDNQRYYKKVIKK